MYQKTVEITFKIDGQDVKVLMHVSCTPETYDHEIIRRASKLFLIAVEEAHYEVK
jgi:hypothetical protein